MLDMRDEVLTRHKGLDVRYRRTDVRYKKESLNRS